MSTTATRRKIKPLTPIEFAAKYSKAEIAPICEAAGTNYDYWKRIRDRRQRPSVDLARALVAASGGELDLDALLFPKTEIRRKGAPPVRPNARTGRAVLAGASA